MTRDEAIDILRCRKDGNAADALEVLLRIAEAQPCADAVSREAVRKAIHEWFFDIEDCTKPDDIINNLPSVQPERENGEWRKGVSENGITPALFCSNCGFENNRCISYNFCPNCGADMRGNKE